MEAIEDLLRGEFIGKWGTIRHPGIQGTIRGRVIDESRNMIVLEKEGEELSIPKKGSRITVETTEGNVDILGEWITGRPADRIKKKFRRSML